MAQTENREKTDIWRNIQKLMNRKNLYAIIVGTTLAYFTVNRSLIGMSESRITAYSLIFLMSLIPIYTSKENIVTGVKGLIQWEGKGKAGGLLSMAASWAVGLFAGLAGMLIIAAFNGREIVALPSESLINVMAQQALIVCPVETIVFCVVLPQYMSSAFGKGKWGNGLTFVLSQGAFAIFHYWTYAGNLQYLAVAFAMGMIFLTITLMIRPEMAQGMHTGVNGVNLGFFAIG